MNRNIRSRKGKKKKEGKQESPVEALLRQLILVNKEQSVKTTSEVKDVAMPVIKRHKVHTFVRKQNFGNITGSVSAEVDGVFAFSLGSLPDYTEFTSLYDTYRITYVKLDFYPLFIDTSATVPYPPIITAIDYDDNSSVVYSILQEYDTALLSQTGVYFNRVLKPRVALAAYGGAFTQFAQARAGQWIDCASPNTTHYGLKYALPITGAANAVWLVEATYVLQFRESR